MTHVRGTPVAEPGTCAVKQEFGKAGLCRSTTAVFVGSTSALGRPEALQFPAARIDVPDGDHAWALNDHSPIRPRRGNHGGQDLQGGKFGCGRPSAEKNDVVHGSPRRSACRRIRMASRTGYARPALARRMPVAVQVVAMTVRMRLETAAGQRLG